MSDERSQMKRELAKIEQAIAAQESLRDILPDEQMEATLAGLRAKQTELQAQLASASETAHATEGSAAATGQAAAIVGDDNVAITGQVEGGISIARGEKPKAASGRSVAADKIEGPVVTGDEGIAAGGDVVFAEGGSEVQIGDRRTQIGGRIQAETIQAQNVVSGVQTIGAPDPQAVADLRRQIADLQAQLVQATAAGEAIDEDGDAQQALAQAEEELAKEEPRGERVVHKLEYVTKILKGSADTAQAMGKAGIQVVKLAMLSSTLWQMAQKLFGG